MIYPSIDKLLKSVDSKYSLVIAAAKRARQIQEGASILIDTSSKKDVTVALEEISEKQLIYEKTKQGIK
ncbi:DNA-directed RNA polymerase subunit omega [Candidatus Contubernalis alkaliaceticus]|uniref:DNA-directed RNA polymerase subunit omega n=1 Tax=Candidatus Contubernalis alkaliaceticus TaxID=338645 RepID=UPI001F4C0DBB|nr:DNA-directed RNA polymerase subunit omega [Candidatus Contubernalis alkalaceticus]